MEHHWKRVIFAAGAFGSLALAVYVPVTKDSLMAMLGRAPSGARVTYEVHGKDGELVDRYTVDDPDGPDGRHTLKFIIGGSKMDGIVIKNLDTKVSTSTSDVFTIETTTSTSSIYVDEFVLKNVHAARLDVEDSDFWQMRLARVTADGASTHLTAPSVPLTRRGLSSYDELPIWEVDGAKYDVIEISASTDAEVRFIALDGVRVPGKMSISDIKANRFVMEDSTVGEGDGFASKDFVFTNVRVNAPLVTSVAELPVDNTR